MADLQDLLARLQNQKERASSTTDSNQPSSSPVAYQQPSVSSPIFSPAPSGPQPHHSSAILSPNTSAMNTPAPEPGNATRATDLLSLLKFKQSNAQSASSVTSPTSLQNTQATPQFDATSGAQNRPVSAADLVAGFTRRPSGLSSVQSPSALTPTSSRPELRGEASASSAKSQDFLLKLLNHQVKPNRSDGSSFTSSLKHSEQALDTASEAVVDDLAQGLEDATLENVSSSPVKQREREQSPMHVFGEAAPPPTSTFDAPEPAKKKPFTYVNPFEQLSASSPLNRTPKPESRSITPKIDILKHSRDASTASVPPAKAQKMSPDESTRASLPASSTPHETVSEALNEVGEVVDKQVEQALAQMTSKANGDSEPKEVKAVREAAAEIKEELKDKKTRREMEAGMSKPMAKAFEATIDAAVAKPAAKPAADEDWEEAAKAADKDVRVFNFPMRPFISIDIKQLEETPLVVPRDTLMDIAKIQKPFDQIDRNMVSGSSSYMVYPLKHGGLRVIKQDDGSHKQVFSHFKERIFNISLSHTQRGGGAKETETVLATGIDGTVFWAPLANFARDETFGQSEEERGFIFPPIPTNDDNTSGGQLKTRVKPSSRNPEFFGYGRGKSIFIIFPGVARTAEYTDSETRVCDSEKFLRQHMLRVSTGKAGKDFIFSADDTVLVSLDKAGRLKFWDLRSLTQPVQDKMSSALHIEVEVPLMTLETCLPNEKSWPTSVMLLDKDKPMAKGIALRYVIIGMKQNHTLQIWDLALGKQVEEINFPHDKESDAICSLAYHPRTGILAVGHPTRNSIYFLHVSAPQYNLPAMPQAKFIGMVANKDPTLPAPASTVIISGIREYTLGSKGTIRSLDMLNDPTAQYGEGAALFVLYIMHSKGIAEMRVNREHLGWSEAGKILSPVNAAKTGAITVNELKSLPAPIAGDAVSVSSESPATTIISRSGKDSETRKVESTPLRERKPPVAEPKTDTTSANAEKPEKKKKKDKKASEIVSQANSTAASPFNQSADSSRSAEVEPPKSPLPSKKSKPESKMSDSEVVPSWATRLLENVSSSAQGKSTVSTTSTNDFVVSEFENLYRKIGEDKRVQEAASAAKQEAVLRLVSTTLAENVEGALNRAVTEGLTKIMQGPIKEVIVTSIDRSVNASIGPAVKTALARDLEKVMPAALSHVLQDPTMLQNVSDRIANHVTLQVDGYLTAAMRENISPAFADLAVNSARKMSSDIERRFVEQIRQADVQRQQDNTKIDHLLQTVANLTQLVQSMAQDQAKFQQDTVAVLRQSQAQTHQIQAQIRAQSPQVKTPAKVVKSPEEKERDEITTALEKGDLEDATVKWLHSNRQNDLFVEIFCRLDPTYLQSLTPLVILTVAAIVTNPLNDLLIERLTWLDVALQMIDARSPELGDNILPRICTVIQQRLQEAYMGVSEKNSVDPVLKHIAVLNRRATDLKNTAEAIYGTRD